MNQEHSITKLKGLINGLNRTHDTVFQLRIENGHPKLSTIPY